MRGSGTARAAATGGGRRLALGPSFAGNPAFAAGQADTADRELARDQPLATSDCYARLRPVLRSYLRHLVPVDDVDDVVQASFVDLWRTRARYDPAQSVEAWALSIARRRAIDYLRSRPRPAAPLGDLAETLGEDGRDHAARHADAAELCGALLALPRPQREAIELAYYGQLSQQEIAERLRVPIGTVKARTARGLRRVRQTLMAAPGPSAPPGASRQSGRGPAPKTAADATKGAAQ
jgi:RNA polymerase sigma factor (sigma-70 family)